MTKERRHFSGEEKVAIVRRHLVDRVPMSDRCDEYRLQPTQIYTWQKQLFENGGTVFSRPGCPAANPGHFAFGACFPTRRNVLQVRSGDGLMVSWSHGLV